MGFDCGGWRLVKHESTLQMCLTFAFNRHPLGMRWAEAMDPTAWAQGHNPCSYVPPPTQHSW
jgi:hypothetical protein